MDRYENLGGVVGGNAGCLIESTNLQHSDTNTSNTGAIKTTTANMSTSKIPTADDLLPYKLPTPPKITCTFTDCAAPFGEVLL